MENENGMREYLRSLQASIESQDLTIESLRKKNKRLEEKLKNAESYSEDLRNQVEALSREVSELKKSLPNVKNETTEPIENEKEDSEPKNITEEITKAANEVVEQEFLKSMAFEETSGLYYDYNTGLYYDNEKKMYYDGNKGEYLRYNYETSNYERLNSNMDVINEDSNSTSEGSDINDEKTTSVELKSKTKSSEELSEGEISCGSPKAPPSKRKKNSSKEKKKIKQELKIPCIRMVVHKSSESATSSEGTLFIVVNIKAYLSF